MHILKVIFKKICKNKEYKDGHNSMHAQSQCWRSTDRQNSLTTMTKSRNLSLQIQSFLLQLHVFPSMLLLPSCNKELCPSHILHVASGLFPSLQIPSPCAMSSFPPLPLHDSPSLQTRFEWHAPQNVSPNQPPLSSRLCLCSL